MKHEKMIDWPKCKQLYVAIEGTGHPGQRTTRLFISSGGRLFDKRDWSSHSATRHGSVDEIDGEARSRKPGLDMVTAIKHSLQ